MDIKQMKDFVSQELKGLKQEHRLLSLRRNLRAGRGPWLFCKCWSSGESGRLRALDVPKGQGRSCWRVLTVPAEPLPLQSLCLLVV